MEIEFKSRYDHKTLVFWIEAFDGDAKIGYFSYCRRTKEMVKQQYPALRILEDKLYPLGVEVEPKYRRTKVATRFYEIAEETSGLRIMPGDSGTIKPDGIKFRKAYEQAHGTWLEPFRK